MMNDLEFYKKYLSASKQASKLTGLDYRQILANWSWETNFGTNKTVNYNNLGGIKFVNQKYASGKSGSPGYAKYNTINDFVKDYARVMNLGYYDQIHKASKTPGLLDDVIEHNKSAYSVADYDVNAIMKRISDIGKMNGNNQNINLEIPNVKEYSKDELIKYASIGVGIIALIKLLE